MVLSFLNPIPHLPPFLARLSGILIPTCQPTAEPIAVHITYVGIFAEFVQ